MKQPIKIWTDGSSFHKNRLGGIGVYIKDGKKEYCISEGYCCTTIGRMELRALISALKSIKNKKRDLKIWSDAMYVINSFSDKYLKEQINYNFKGLTNADLIRQLACEKYKFTGKLEIYHINGHLKETGNVEMDEIIQGNNFADILASYSNFKYYKRDLNI